MLLCCEDVLYVLIFFHVPAYFVLVREVHLGVLVCYEVCVCMY